MERSGGSSDLLFACAAVLGAVAAVVGLVSSLPFGIAISLALGVVGLTPCIVQQFQIGPIAPWRDEPSLVGLMLIAGGGLVLGITLIVSAPTSSASKVWGPTVAPTRETTFTGVTKGTVIEARLGSPADSRPKRKVPPGQRFVFSGFCLPPVRQLSPLDRRWYVVAGSELLIPAGDVRGSPPAGSLPEECGVVGGLGFEPSLELKIGREYEFIEGIKAPFEPDSAFSFALGAIGESTAEIGFAALGRSDRWIPLGIDFKPATPGTFALILPVGLSRPEIDRTEPVKVLAVTCYAPKVPGPTPTVGEVRLNGLRPPILLGQRVLWSGVAADARKAACSPSSSGAVG